MTAKEYLKDVGLIQRNSVFKCKDVELQPIECETYKNCKSCPHYKKTDSNSLQPYAVWAKIALHHIKNIKL